MGQDHNARNSVVFESFASDPAHVFLIPYMPRQEASAAHLDKSKTCAQKSYGIPPILYDYS
jgi:hypothetical protein